MFKMSFLPNLICKFNAIPTKILASYFVDMDKLILKFMWRGKRHRIDNKMLKTNHVGGCHYSTSRLNIMLQKYSVVLVKE